MIFINVSAFLLAMEEGLKTLSAWGLGVFACRPHLNLEPVPVVNVEENTLPGEGVHLTEHRQNNILT